MHDEQIYDRLTEIRTASRELRRATTERKNAVLSRVAELLIANEKDLLKANQKDIGSLKKEKTNPSFVDRLKLTPERIRLMQESLLDVAALKDPVGDSFDQKSLANGLRMKRVRSPLGVILMIFESRPNVVTEVFSLGFKSGNALILRGGSESTNSTGVLYQCIHQALRENGFTTDVLWGILDADRTMVQFLMKQNRFIDVLVPRGGNSLIEYVTSHATIPIIKNDRGMCHVYVHDDADLTMAINIIVNGKCQRPGVCNSVETVLLHEKVAADLVPRLHEALAKFQVQWFASRDVQVILKNSPEVHLAVEKNWDTEYLDFKINCKTVPSLDAAIAHIEDHGSRHSEAIITSSEPTARRFQEEVDAAAVYWNASTRFTDGYQMGLGGELGISTQKLHVRGPVGLNELTSARWIIDGTGQVRI